MSRKIVVGIHKPQPPSLSLGWYVCDPKGDGVYLSASAMAWCKYMNTGAEASDLQGDYFATEALAEECLSRYMASCEPVEHCEKCNKDCTKACS